MELRFDFLLEGLDVVFGNVFSVDFFSCNFHVGLIGEIFHIERVFIQPEVFGSGSHESFLVTDDFAIKGVNDGIGLFEKTVDPADLLKVLFPFSGMFDDDTKIDIFILGLDSSGDFFTLNDKKKVRKLYRCCQLSRQ